MQESASSNELRSSRSAQMGLPKDFTEVSISLARARGRHPQGWPVAGITICTFHRKRSDANSRPLRCAMTGEITLRARFWPIGALRKNCWPPTEWLAYDTLPKDNEKDLPTSRRRFPRKPDSDPG